MFFGKRYLFSGILFLRMINHYICGKDRSLDTLRKLMSTEVFKDF